MTREQLQQIRDALAAAANAKLLFYEMDEAFRILDAALAAPEQEPVATDCTRIMREQGKPYPRTCPRCGFGPCVYSSTIVIAAPVPAPQPVSMETVYDTIIEWSTAGKGSRRELARRMIALFATPQREWAELEDDEVTEIADRCTDVFGLADLISEALRAKNEVKNHG